MLKRFSALGSIPVFPAVLALGALILGLPCLKILLLGFLAVGLTLLSALLLSPRSSEAVPLNWRRELRKLRRTVEKIKNRSVYRNGHDILTELKQCETSLPFLSSSARQEITEYYLPAFSKYFTAYATFEECNEGNPSILSTMAQMEESLEQIASNFRKACDRNDRTAALNIHAQTAVLSKKLDLREGTYDQDRT